MARLPTLAQPLTEAHGFRQTQTAYTALIYHRQGIDLLRPELPVLGPPWLVPFEFPLVQAVGSLLMDIGIAPDVAMRIVGLALHLLTAALLFGLARRVAGDVAAMIAVGAFLFSPFGMLWGRTSMIEFGATAGGVGVLWAGTAWLDSRRGWLYVAALVAGLVAMLVKPSTGIWYLMALLAWRPTQQPAPWRDPRAWILLGIPLAAGLGWTAWADAIKGATPTTASLTSAELRDWYFGLITDRFDMANWATIIGRVVEQLTGLALLAWILLAAVGAIHLPQRRFVGALAAAAVLPLVVLLPLYRQHDYYLAAISPIVAFAVAIGGAWLWSRRSRPMARIATATLISLWLVTLVTFDWWRIYEPSSDPVGTLSAAQYVADHSEPGETVVVLGRSWDPSILYYANRRGLALQSTASALAGYDVVFSCPYGRPCETVRR